MTRIGRACGHTSIIGCFYFVFVVLLLAGAALAQQDSASSASAQPGIQDNSFLIEEAYNQNFGVVQHISSFTRFWNSKDWAYIFTQEWPVPGDARHQLSYTVPFFHAGAFQDSGVGIGDVFLHYRYQALADSAYRPAFQ